MKELNKTMFFQEHDKCKEQTELPKTDNMVLASSLAKGSEQEVIQKTSAFLIETHGARFVVQQQTLVPSTATIVRDSQNAIVGLPAVVGG